MTDIRTHGFKTKAELEEHLADVEEAAMEKGSASVTDDGLEDREAVELARLQRDLIILRSRLALVREQVRIAVSERTGRAPASAPERAADYPWLKLAGAVVATVLAARQLRSLSFS